MESSNHTLALDVAKAVLVDVAATPWSNPRAERAFLSELVGFAITAVWRTRGVDVASIWTRLVIEVGLTHERLGVLLYKVIQSYSFKF